MKTDFKDKTPCISLIVLASLCFVTLVMCQTQFKISKEMSHEVYPPILQSKDCWFFYTFGNPDRLKCVLRAFIVMSSPLMSLISTGLLVFGKVESNPYFFLPWLFLTFKGLLVVQTDNIINILKDMATRTNYAYGFRAEDLKWLVFYSSIFLIDLVEICSFYEIFDLFLVLWNHHPGFSVESAGLDIVKKEIAEIMDSLSKYSLESLSKISLGTFSESDFTNNLSVKDISSIVRFMSKEDETSFGDKDPDDFLLFMKSSAKNVDKKVQIKDEKTEKAPLVNDMCDGDAPSICLDELRSAIETRLKNLPKYDANNEPKTEKIES